MSKWNANREGYADNTASIAIQRVSKEERKNDMAKRSCRRTTDENAIHNKAVKIRKMTDEQLVHYVEDRVEKARSDGDRIRQNVVTDASKLQAGDNMLSQTFNDGIYSAVGGVTYVDIKCAATKDSEHIPTSEEYTKVNVSVESRQKIVIADTRIEVVYSGHS